MRVDFVSRASKQPYLVNSAVMNMRHELPRLIAIRDMGTHPVFSIAYMADIGAADMFGHRGNGVVLRCAKRQFGKFRYGTDGNGRR
ncbi:MAG: hypothetical protein AAFP99_03305 [Pseudomonadota bacterium]